MNRTTVFSTGCIVGILSLAGVVACEDSPSADPLAPRPEMEMSVTSSDFLVCPVSEWQIAWGVVTPGNGGTVAVQAGGITVPAGAVDRATFITVLAPKGPHAILDIRANGREHFQFEESIRITFDYSRCEDAASANTLQAWEIDSRTHTPIAPVSGSNDPDAAEFRINPNHLTSYTIATN